jgi:hypothetical protein
MRTTRRTLLVLAVLALVLPLAATAGAKGHQPDKPPGKPETVLYEVTMTLEQGDEGLATTCPETDGFIMMEGGKLGYKAGVGGPEVARLRITATIPWSGRMTEPAFGDGFDGECYGGEASGSEADWAGTLLIYADSAGNPTEFLWHFDHYASLEYYGRDKVRTVLNDGFTLRSLCDRVDPKYDECQEFEATEREQERGTYDVSGTFTLYVWDRTIIPNPYVFQGSSFFEFTMTFTEP